MVEAKKQESPHSWWFDSHSKGNSNRSPWLQTTLADLDEKTRAMLQLVEEDADSFAKRAEMYYKKRPELISMVEDFYRTHRSLAERYDLVKTEPGTRRISSPWSSPLPPTKSSPLPFTKYRIESLNLNDKAYDSYSEACGPEEWDESEVDDPEEEDVDDPEEEDVESETEQESSGALDEQPMSLEEIVGRLKEENEAQRVQLKQKDEEKREVIRQLSRAMEMLREENAELREHLVKKTPKKGSQPESSKVKDNFLGMLFNGFGKPPTIAL